MFPFVRKGLCYCKETEKPKLVRRAVSVISNHVTYSFQNRNAT